MNSLVIFLFAIVAAVSATVPYSIVHPAPVVVPSYRESILPTYNYYRVANLPADRFPPGVDPVKCPNYPYCGTDAGKLVVPSVAPVVSSVPSVKFGSYVKTILPAPIAHLPGFASRYYVVPHTF